MRAIVFNNTCRFHHGSAAVMRVLHDALTRAGIEITQSVYGNTRKFEKRFPSWDDAAFDAADLIVINGEGTMHDDSGMSAFLMDKVLAKAGHRKTALVNSLWQNMSPHYTRMLQDLDLVTAREPASAQAMELESAIVIPDLSYFDVPPRSPLPPGGLVKGTFYRRAHAKMSCDTTVDVTTQDWAHLVNSLRAADALFTGKHHEVYAACIARCPFVVSAINTHKVSALGQLIDRELPIVHPDADEADIRRTLAVAAQDADGLFAALFDKMETLRRTHDPARLFASLA